MKDISQAVGDAKAFDDRVIVGLWHAVSHTTTVLTMKARGEHRWRDITGGTRESIKGSLQAGAKGATGTISAGYVAKLLNDGTPAHLITARGDMIGPLAEGGRRRRGASYLKFQIGGRTLYRQSVHHPGTKTDPFLDAAADAAMDELMSAVDAAIGDALG